MLYVLLVLAVLLGILAQRVAGLGFAMVVAPALVLLLGPFEGVLLTNLTGALSAALVIARVWRHIDWRQFALLTVPALVLIVPGTLISVWFNGPGLQVAIGAILAAALTVSVLLRRSYRRTPAVPTALVCGATAGFTSATAGVGGPAVSVHAMLTRWDQRTFAATIQPYFVVTGSAAFVGKLLVSPGGLPSYDWWLWVLILVAMIVGLLIAEPVSRWVSVRAARITVILIAYTGAIVAIVQGVRGLL